MRDHGRKLVVVSTHLDDAVLSVGGTIAALAGAGAEASIVTVFGGDPESTEPAGAWDRAAGFFTAGEATRARREEDRLACEVIGANPHWLSFEDEQYGGVTTDGRWHRSLGAASSGADSILIPGFPLSHPDHRQVGMTLLRQPPLAPHAALYVEQPYALAADSPSLPGSAGEPLPQAPSWTAVGLSRRSRTLKWRACLAYRSQMPLLRRNWRLMRLRMRLYEFRKGGEPVGWLR